MSPEQTAVAENIKFLVARICAWPMTGKYPQCFVNETEDGWFFCSGCMFDLDFDEKYNIKRARLNCAGTTRSELGEFQLQFFDLMPVNSHLRASGCRFENAMNLLIDYKVKHTRDTQIKKKQSKKKTKLETLQGRVEHRIAEAKVEEAKRQEKREFWKRPPKKPPLRTTLF